MTAELAWVYVTPVPSTNADLSLSALSDESAQASSTVVERDAFLQINLTDYASLRRRLAELRELGPGWLEGAGERPHPQVLRCASITLRRMLRLGTPRPRLYPTPEGGVQAEWTIDSREVSLTFEPDGTVYASVIDVESGMEAELQDGDADQFAQFVLRAQ